jgi:hypothetical protein
MNPAARERFEGKAEGGRRKEEGGRGDEYW